MAHLPDAQSLGIVVPQPDRPIASYQGGTAAEGQAAIAGAVENVGAQTVQAGQQISQVADAAATAKAEQQFLTAKSSLDQAAQNDQDYTTLPDRYTQGIQKAAADAGSQIMGAAARADFQERIARYMEFGIDSANATAQRKKIDDQRGQLSTMLDQNSSTFANATDQTTATGIADNARDLIETAAMNGAITHEEGASLWQRWGDEATKARGDVLIAANPLAAQTLLRQGFHQAVPGLVGAVS